MAIEILNQDGSISVLDVETIKNMKLRQFVNYRGVMMNVVNERRYDKAIALVNTTVPEKKDKRIFRRGIGEEDTTFDGTTFIKDEWHTNMLKDGAFDVDDFAVVTNIEVEFNRFGGKPAVVGAAQTDMGKILNAKATFPANYDPALVAHSWLNQLWVAFVMGKTTLIEGRAIDFMQSSSIRAAFGSNGGAFADNGGSQKKFLEYPIPIKGGADFGVIITPYANYDLTTANGLNETLVTTVVLDTVELQKVK